MATYRKTHRVRHDGGAQSLISIALDASGDPVIPTSATHTILDLRVPETGTDREIVASTASTVDSASTTLSAAAGAGTSDRRLLSAVDASGFSEDHKYLLTDATTGRRKLVDVAWISSNSIYLRQPLVDGFASGSALAGIEVTSTFPAAEAADDDSLDDGGGPYALDLVWVGVDPPNQREIVFVERTPENLYAVTLDQCEMLSPSLRKKLVNHDNAAEQFLDQAHSDWRAELAALGLNPSDYYGAENHREYIKARWAMHGHRYLPGGEGDFNDRLADSFERRARVLLNTFMAGGNNPHGTVVVDPDEDDADDGTSLQKGRLFGLS